ncbi:sulfatase [Marinobacter alkaliphilus]|uniref:Sulfatase n=1 Tax=Marinobacter alkaliphilus TaxID=254719 RepID=A0ABZ3E4I0_9GAMM
MLAAFVLFNGLLLLPAMALSGPAPWLALEALFIWWLLHRLPSQRNRLVLLLSSLYALMVLLIAADALVRQSLGRGLNLYLEVGLLDAAWHLLRTNLGIPGAVLVVIALIFAAALVAWLFRRLGLHLARAVPVRGRALWVSAVTLLTLTVLTPWVGSPALAFVANQGSLILHTHQATSAFRAGLEQQPTASRQPRELPGLANADVVLAFVESYGISGLTDERYRPVLGPRLATLAEQLDNAGLTVATGRLKAPIQGGQSWLGHLSVLSGQWINTQIAYEALLSSNYATLIDDFRVTGHQTMAVMPAITREWPEGQLFGYHRIYDQDALGYQGPAFNWVTMPDQFTWHRFEQLRQASPAPVFAELALISSHAPWVPILPVLDDWDSIGDGQVFQQWEGAGEAPASLWRDPERVREHYIQAIDYALAVAGDYAARYLTDGTLLFILGDHQPAPLITGDDASRDVIIHVISRNPTLVAPFLNGDLPGFQPGTLPDEHTDGAPMSRFRAFLLAQFGEPSRPLMQVKK